MHRIAEFKKVSFDEFLKDSRMINMLEQESYESIKEQYEGIVLPTRSTSGSAGYDIRSPFNFVLNPGDTITVPTGLRCKIAEGWFFMIVPRSGLGFKYRLQLDNTVGIIDSDYYHADNEGHIMARITNDSRSSKILTVESGDRFCQGIFVPYGITFSDDAQSSRKGGFGSSGVN